MALSFALLPSPSCQASCVLTAPLVHVLSAPLPAPGLCPSPLRTQLAGKHLRVDRATIPGSKRPAGGDSGAAAEYDPQRTVFLGNLHFEVEVGTTQRCRAMPLTSTCPALPAAGSCPPPPLVFPPGCCVAPCRRTFSLAPVPSPPSPASASSPLRSSLPLPPGNLTHAHILGGG